MENVLRFIVPVVFWGVVVGLLAKRKNRDPFVWGIAGAVSWLIALVVLAFMPYICPECEGEMSNKDAKLGKCQNCQ